MKMLKHQLRIVAVFYITIIIVIGSVTGQYYAGDPCRLGRRGQSGRCTRIGRCPFALQQYRQNIHPQLCGFHGKEPIVCCPRESQNIIKPPEPVSSPPGTISNQKCQEYTKGPKEVKLHPVTAIVGGTPVTVKEFPHMAALGFGDENDIQWQCGGALISEEFVLTAAHCLYSQEFGDVQYVRLGDFNLRSDSDDAEPQDLRVALVYRHPDYKPPSQYNDIALIKLNQPAKLTNYVKPACLQTEYVLPEGVAPVATGWGRLGFTGEVSDQLMKVTLSYFTNDQCKQVYASSSHQRLSDGIVDNTQLCAGGINTSKDTCQGDSGGPLQIKNFTNPSHFYIIGITSFGKGCGIENIPGVYTRVSNYIPWIEEHVWPNV